MQYSKETTQEVIEKILNNVPSITVVSDGTPSSEVKFLTNKDASSTILDEIIPIFEKEALARGYTENRKIEKKTGSSILSLSKKGYKIILGILISPPQHKSLFIAGTVVIRELKTKKRLEDKKVAITSDE